MSVNELDVMKQIDQSLSQLDDSARERVLVWVQSKYGGSISAEPSKPSKAASPSPAKSTGKIADDPKAGKKKSGKQSYTIDKSLNLFPSDKKTFTVFSNEKMPKNQKEKCVAATYYLTEILEMKASVDRIYTCFKAMQWALPKDLKNILHQAGSAGWLDTSNDSEIKLTPMGENLIEQTLPKNPKK